MPGKILLTATVLAVFLGAFALKGRLPERSTDPIPDATPARRIVSLAPSVTETLFALGLGDRVVGVTRFCEYPPEVANKARTGGFLDPNIEAIVALAPDLVVTLASGGDPQPAFEELNLRTLVVDHRDIDGILDSITAIGRACGASSRADAMVAELRARMDRVAQKTAGRPRPRILVAINRGLDAGQLEDVYVAGNNRSFQTMVEMAGGENVFQNQTAAFPVVSTEGILHANPEVIIDLIPTASRQGRSAASLVDDWRQIPEVDAVRHGRVYVLGDDYPSVPGPRFILLVERLARLLHPEVDGDGP